MAAASSSSPSQLPPSISIIERYSLINDGSSNENGSPSSSSPKLSAFVVRLTDASLKALNQALADAKQKKGKGALNGFIELGNRGSATEGTLCFGGTSSVIHRFSLTDAQRDLGPKGQLDVIEQQRISEGDKIRSGKSSPCGRMKSIGPVTQRLQISATTEDTFESTKQKTQQANEEMRRTAAKVALKGPAGAGGITKVWQKIGKAQASTSQRPMTPLSNQHQKSIVQNHKMSTNGTSTGVVDITKRPLRQRIMYKLLSTPATAVDLLNKLSSEGLSDHERFAFDRTLNEVAQVSRSPDSSSDALSVYEVKKACYQEIRVDDWPYYSAWERQQARKKLFTYKNPIAHQQQHCGGSGSNANGASDNSDDNTTRRVSGKISYRPPPKKPAANDSPKTISSNASVSPPMAAPAMASSPRLPSSAATASPATISHSDDTRQRVSAKVGFKPPPKRPPTASPLVNGTTKSPNTNGGSPTVASTTTSAYSPPPKKKKSNKDNDIGVDRQAAVNETNGRDFEEDANSRRKRRQQHQRPALTTSNNDHSTSNGHSNDHAAPNSVPPPDPPDDNVSPPSRLDSINYRTEYPAITSADIRRRYKEEFDRDYAAYLKFYERLRVSAKEFEMLGDKLKRTSKESSEYKDTVVEIVNKYRKYERDPDVCLSKKEHERLRRKLEIIKERVKEFDDRQLAMPVVSGINDW